MKVFFNYDWLHAKLSAMSIHDVLHDFDAAIKAGISDPELGLVASALRVGGPNIASNANSLACDLLGRLLVYYDYQALLFVLLTIISNPQFPDLSTSFSFTQQSSSLNSSSDSDNI